jgi:ribosomal protein S18 acetylase RimI-like enzyme
MNPHFYKNDWLFELTMPEYEIDTFGGKIGELRKVDTDIAGKDVFDLDEFKPYCAANKILSCTFRGKEDIKLVRYLNEIGFMFVGTFFSLSCDRNDFKKIEIGNNLKVTEANKNEFNKVLDIELKVFDYSSYQLDPMFPLDTTSKRNVKRVAFYFNNPDHHLFVIKKDEQILGFIQFLYDTKAGIASAVNGAIDPDFHEQLVGSKMYSDSFASIFNQNINKIVSHVCAQNVRALKIHLATNFKIIDHELHLRAKYAK